MLDPLDSFLVVEDDSAIRTMVVAALKREPSEVHTASDGLAVLECVGANDYAVILLSASGRPTAFTWWGTSPSWSAAVSAAEAAASRRRRR